MARSGPPTTGASGLVKIVATPDVSRPTAGVAHNRATESVHRVGLDEPLRLEIDVDGPGTGGAEKRFPIKDELVAGVRVAPRAGGLSVMIDLKRDPGPSEVRAEGTEVIAELGERYVTRPAL